MAESSKSVPEMEQAKQDDKNVTIKDLGTLTKNIVDAKSSVFDSLKEQTAVDFHHVQQDYVDKEKQVYDAFKDSTHFNNYSTYDDDSDADVAKVYETILRENIAKLKDIAYDDFDKANENSRLLIDEAKGKLHTILTGAFKAQESKPDFAKTTENIFIGINDKIRDDLHMRNKKHEKTKRKLEADYSNVFVNPNTQKSREEIEAERILQQVFEDQLWDYYNQFIKDIHVTDRSLAKQIEETKEQVSASIQSALTSVQQTELPTVNIDHIQGTGLPNAPTASKVEKDINTLLNKAQNDFQNINESMKNDINESRRKVDENVKYYSNKIIEPGKNLLGLNKNNDDDESEDS